MTNIKSDIVLVRLYAAARAATGRSEISVSPKSAQEILVEISGGDANTLGLFSRCSILIQGEQLHDRERLISGGSEMDVLPPFAGGSR